MKKSDYKALKKGQEITPNCQKFYHFYPELREAKFFVNNTRKEGGTPNPIGIKIIQQKGKVKNQRWSADWFKIK